jgi:hypothetical protein
MAREKYKAIHSIQRIPPWPTNDHLLQTWPELLACSLLRE